MWWTFNFVVAPHNAQHGFFSKCFFLTFGHLEDLEGEEREAFP
jgi:hypothetical protein